MSELMELPAVVDESDKLAPISIFESQIARFKKEYALLKIDGIADKAGYDKVVEAHKEIKNQLAAVEKVRVKLNEDALLWQRQVNSKARTVKADFEAIKEPIEKLRFEYEAEKERIKNEAALNLKKRNEDRAAVITSIEGVKFNGRFYGLGETAILQSELETLSDSEFQDKVELFEAEASEILKAKLEADRLAKLEAERLETQRKEQEAASAEIKRQQEEIQAEKHRMETERLEIQRKADEEESKRLAKIKAEQDAIDAEKRELERKEELQKAREGAARKAKADAELKANRDALAKAEAEKAAKEKEARKLARRPDIEKFEDMCNQVVKAVESFEFKTEEGRISHKNFRTGIELLIKTTGIKES